MEEYTTSPFATGAMSQFDRFKLAMEVIGLMAKAKDVRESTAAKRAVHRVDITRRGEEIAVIREWKWPI